MLILILWMLSTELLPRAQQKEDLVISVQVPTSLDSVSVSDYCAGTFFVPFYELIMS